MNPTCGECEEFKGIERYLACLVMFSVRHFTEFERGWYQLTTYVDATAECKCECVFRDLCRLKIVMVLALASS